jgi:fimbrial chaperone protein
MSSASFVSRLLSTALLALGISTGVQASSLSISPITVTLDEKTQSAAFTLKNESSESRVIQTELLRWTQEKGENVHAPSRDILVNPPIATLRPGQTQIIRIGLNRKVDSKRELAYRLYVSEVPPPPKEGFTGLRIALRLGLAVFVSPKAEPTGKLEWAAVHNPGEALRLTLHNNSNRHVRLTNLEVRDFNNGQQLAELQQPQFTVLAGQTHQMSLSLPAGWQGRQLSLVAGTENGLIETIVRVEQPAK